jgi:D-amino-acid dehydrogenase
VRDLGLKLPLQAGKGYSLTLPRPRQLPQICAIFTEARMAVTPLNGALRFGGTLEISGLNETINPARVRGIINAVPGYYPDFAPADFDGLQPWRGLRPCSPDGLPYLGRTAKYANLTLATGHAMMGMSLGPVTGSLVAEIISGVPPRIDLSLLSPDRHH